MSTVIIALTVSVLVGVFLGWMQSFSILYRKSILLWITGVLGLTSFFGLSWVTYAEPGTISENAKIVSQKASFWEALADYPLFEEILSEKQLMSQQDILILFEEYPYNSYVDIIESEKKITGWQLMQLSRYKKPEFSVLLGVSVILMLLSTLAAFIQLLPIGKVSSSLKGFLSLILVILIINFLQYIPTFDTLGLTEDFKMRLLAVLAEAQISETYLLYLMSWVFIVVSGLEYIFLIFAPRSFVEYPDGDQDFNY